MASAFSDHRVPGSQPDQARADSFHNQSQGMPVSQFHPSLPGAASPFRPTWAIADDIFWERYGTALRGTEGSWRALPHLRALSGQLYTATSNTSFSTLFQGPGEEDFIDGPSSAIDPWLLQPPPNADSPSVLGVGRSGQPQPPAAAAASASHRHLLFQYKPYCQQDPLHLSEQDVAAVLEVAFGKVPYTAPKDSNTTQDTSTPGAAGGGALPRPPSSLWGGGGGGGSTLGGGAGMNQSPSDVACVVLVKLIMDLYLSQGPQLTFSMVNFMLQRALLHGDDTSRARVFDLILNLAVHGELLYDAPGDQVPEDDAAVVEAVAKLDRAGPSADWRHTVTSALRASLAVGLDTPTSAASAAGNNGGLSAGFGYPHSGGHAHAAQGQQEEELEGEGDGNPDDGEWPPLPRPSPIGLSAAHSIDPRGQRFRQWLRLLLFRMLSVLCSVNTPSEAAWAAAASCLAVLSTHEGHVVFSFTQEMPLEAAAALLEQSKQQEWPHSFRCWIGCLAANLMYSKKLDTTNNNGNNHSSGGGRNGINAAIESSYYLDASRIKAFGGIRAITRNYLDAPTLKCRRAFFCVMFDYLVSGDIGGGGGGREENISEVDLELEACLSQARSLLRGVHISQIDALGAALLYTRAAEALCPIFKLSIGGHGKNIGSSGSGGSISFLSEVLHDVAADITSQIAAVHEVYPSQVVQPPPGLVQQCLRALVIMAAAAAGAAPASTEDENSENNEIAEVEKLCTRLKDGVVGSDTLLLRLLIEAADKEVVAGRQPAVSLLPSPPSIGLVSQSSSVASILEQTLPDIRGNAANGFMRAVHALLDYAQLATVGLVSTTTPAATTAWKAVHFPSLALQTLTIATEWLNLAPPGARQRALAAAAERAVAVMTVRKIDSGADGTAELSSLDTPNSSEGIANSSNGIISSTTQAGVYSTHSALPQGGFNSVTSPVSAGKAVAGEGQHQAQHAQQAADLVKNQQSSEINTVGEGSVEQPGGHKPMSPLSKLMPVPKLTAAWRRLTNPHHGAVASGGGSGGGGGGVSEPSVSAKEEPIRPLSAGLSSLSGAERDAMAAAAAAAASGAAAAAPSGLPPRSPAIPQQQQQQQQQRLLLQQSSYHPHRSRQYSTDVSLLSLAAERAIYERQIAEEAAHYGAEAVAVAETKLTSIDSYLSGVSDLIPGILSIVPPDLLKNLMDGLKSELLLSPSVGASGGGGGSVRSTQGKTESSQSRLSAIQAGRPLWDARAAIVILLLKKQETATGSLVPVTAPVPSLVDITFIASLLADSDPRVRRHVSTFILSRFAQQKAQQYRIAVREVVAKAQRNDDDRILKSAEAQVKAMLEGRLMSLEGLV